MSSPSVLIVPSAETDDRAAQNALQLVLEAFELVQRMGVLDAFADVEDGGGKLASLLRRDPGDLGVDRGEDRADHAERGGAQIHQVAVLIHERLGVVVDVVGRP